MNGSRAVYLKRLLMIGLKKKMVIVRPLPDGVCEFFPTWQKKTSWDGKTGPLYVHTGCKQEERRPAYAVLV